MLPINLITNVPHVGTRQVTYLESHNTVLYFQSMKLQFKSLYIPRLYKLISTTKVSGKMKMCEYKKFIILLWIEVQRPIYNTWENYTQP